MSISLSPSGRLLASISKNTLYFWDLHTAQEVHRVEARDKITSGHVAIAYSPKSGFLACGNYIYPTPTDYDTPINDGDWDKGSSLRHNPLNEDTAIRNIPHTLSPLVPSSQIDPNSLEPIFDIFNDYVFNELPSYLLSVQDRTLLSREAIRELLRPQIETITESKIRERMSRLITLNIFGDRRRAAIRKLIRERIPYAIFSHRWFGVGEPTFKDLMTGVDMTGPGFEKLWTFCEKAREWGCEYVWSDTCCIDKSSSAEPEEAIRFMFRWYRNAAICIAYLAQSPTMDDLEAKEWFTRGWTSQELIAQETMKFYGKDWTPLANPLQDGNDKTGPEFMEKVSSVTGISTDDLTHYSPSCSRVYEKIHRAAKRRTTRIEDVAYSLLGMIDVVMPVSYGEGRWAFTRLMEIIVEGSNDLSVFAWAGRSSPHAAALPQSPSSYLKLNREAALSLQLMRKEPFSDGFTQHNAYRRGDRSFTITKRGLQIKLLLVAATMISPSPYVDGHRLLQYLQHRDSMMVDGDHEKLGSLHHGELAPIRVRSQPLALTRYN